MGPGGGGVRKSPLRKQTESASRILSRRVLLVDDDHTSIILFRVAVIVSFVVVFVLVVFVVVVLSHSCIHPYAHPSKQI